MLITERLKEVEDREKNGYNWYITKQDVNFQTQCQLAKVLNSFHNSGTTQSFTKYRSQFPILAGDNYRKLINGPLYGLSIPHNRYEDYKVTQIFHHINKLCSGNFNNLNAYYDIMEQQIEKIYYPLPFYEFYDEHLNQGFGLFITMYFYKVLIELGKKTNKYELTKSEFKLFIATSKSYSQWEETVKMIIQYRKNPSIVKEIHKDKVKECRVQMIYENLKVFAVTSTKITLRSNYIQYITDKVNIFEASKYYNTTYSKLTMDNYLTLLRNPQGILTKSTNNNTTTLNNNSSIVNSISKQHNSIQIDYADNPKEMEEDTAYQNELYNVENDLDNNDDTLISNAHNEPKQNDKTSRKYSGNPTIGYKVIKHHGFTCQYKNFHYSYTSNRTKQMYVEAHHLIPLSLQPLFWNDTIKVNLDTPENIVSLCPNCHGALHKGIPEERNKILADLYNLKINELNKIDISISLNELISFYAK